MRKQLNFTFIYYYAAATFVSSDIMPLSHPFTLFLSVFMNASDVAVDRVLHPVCTSLHKLWVRNQTKRNLQDGIRVPRPFGLFDEYFLGQGNIL